MPVFLNVERDEGRLLAKKDSQSYAFLFFLTWFLIRDLLFMSVGFSSTV